MKSLFLRTIATLILSFIFVGSVVSVASASTEEPNVPPATTLLAPNGTTTDTTPTFRWQRVSSATYYRIWINTQSGTHLYDRWYTAAEVGCSSSSSTVCFRTPVSLGVNAYQYWVQTYNSTGFGPWSSSMKFWVAPGTPTLSIPSGNISDNTPTFVWSSTSGATWYQLWVNNSSGNIYNKWYSASSICGSTSCSITPIAVGYGSHRWWVKAWGNGVYGFWSTSKDFFQRLPGRPTLLSPSGTTTDRTPTFRWTRVNGATWYRLWVDTAGGTHLYDRWYTAAEVSCSSSSSTVCFRTPLSLGNGSYRYWVLPWNSAGYGPWSLSRTFTIATVSAQSEEGMENTVITASVDDATLLQEVQIMDAGASIDASGPQLSNNQLSPLDMADNSTETINVAELVDQVAADAQITTEVPEGELSEPPDAGAFISIEMELPDAENIPPVEEDEDTSMQLYLPIITK